MKSRFYAPFARGGCSLVKLKKKAFGYHGEGCPNREGLLKSTVTDQCDGTWTVCSYGSEVFKRCMQQHLHFKIKTLYTLHP